MPDPSRKNKPNVLFLEGLKFQFEVIFYPGAYDLLMDEQECVLPSSSFDRGQEDGIEGGGLNFKGIFMGNKILQVRMH